MKNSLRGPHYFRNFLLFGLSFSCYSQVVLDGTLNGPAGPLTGPNFDIIADLGSQAETNLFHSFAEFNLKSGESATFSGPNSVQNILSRVTGTNPSNIDGLIRSTINGANLFFLNPNGVMFGPNVQLDISGSFTVSTADYISLGNQGRFDASDPETSSLNNSPVSAFGFLDSLPSSIEFDSSALVVAENQSLSVIGGNLEINGGKLRSQNGEINLVSVASGGEIQSISNDNSPIVDAPNFNNLGKISISNAAEIEIGGVNEGGIGGISIVAEDLSMESNSSLSSVTKEGTIRMDISIGLKGLLEIKDGATISTLTSGAEDGGNIYIQADRISISNTGAEFLTGIRTDSEVLVEDLNISFDIWFQNNFFLDILLASPSNTPHTLLTGDELSGANLSNTTLDDEAIIPISAGTAPYIGVFQPSRELSIFDGEPANGTWTLGILNFSETNTGLLNGWSLDLGRHTIRSTSEPVAIESRQPQEVRTITVSTIPVELISGNSGNILIKTQELELSNSQISTESNGAGSSGDIVINSDKLNVLSDGRVTTLTTAQGAGGNISISTENLELSNAQISTESNGAGSSGDIGINSKELNILSDGRVVTLTAGQGAGGDISVNTNELNLYGSKTSELTGIISFTGGNHSGKGGNIDIFAAGDIKIFDKTEISAMTFGEGDGGSVTIDAKSMLLKAESESGGRTGIFALDEEVGNSGTAGYIDIEVGSLEIIAEAVINATSADVGHRPNINIISQKILMQGNQSSDEATGIKLSSSSSIINPINNHINLETKQLEILDGGLVSSTTTGLEDGGNININSEIIIISAENSKLSTGILAQSEGNLEGGDGGMIQVNTKYLHIEKGGLISTSSLGTGDGGNIYITTEELLVDGGNSVEVSGITAQTQFTEKSGETGDVDLQIGGDSGNINLHSDSLKILDGGVISTSTLGSGDGGILTISADQIFLSRENSKLRTGIISDSLSNIGAGGDAGDIIVNTIDLEIENGSLISSSTVGSGSSGIITVNASSIRLFSQGTIFASAEGETQNGEAGKINITSKVLTIFGGAQVNAITSSLGSGGMIDIETESISISGRGSLFSTGIFATSENVLNNKDSGDINIKATDLSITGGAAISSSTVGSGLGGSVNIDAINVFLSGIGSDLITGIAAISTGVGIGGDVNIMTGNQINLTESVISSRANFNGGNIKIAGPSILQLNSSAITAQAGNNGGNIFIDPKFVILNNSQITANAIIAHGGNINITTEFLIQSDDSSISASSQFGLDGNIFLSGPELDLTGSLIQLEESILFAESQLPEHCAVRLPDDQSSFIITGRGGLPWTADVLQPSAERVNVEDE